jgi:hypothetical protein
MLNARRRRIGSAALKGLLKTPHKILLVNFVCGFDFTFGNSAISGNFLLRVHLPRKSAVKI